MAIPPAGRLGMSYLIALEEMIRLLPKHKGTDSIYADLKKRLSKLKESAEQESKSKKKVFDPFRLEKQGAAQVLVLGLTKVSVAKATQRELRTVVRDLPSDVELWAGGRGAGRYASILTPRGVVFSDYSAYQQELVRLGGHIA